MEMLWHVITIIGDSFVILHTFMKKTQKTPKREIEQALREFADFKERCMHDEK